MVNSGAEVAGSAGGKDVLSLLIGFRAGTLHRRWTMINRNRKRWPVDGHFANGMCFSSLVTV